MSTRYPLRSNTKYGENLALDTTLSGSMSTQSSGVDNNSEPQTPNILDNNNITISNNKDVDVGSSTSHVVSNNNASTAAPSQSNNNGQSEISMLLALMQKRDKQHTDLIYAIKQDHESQINILKGTMDKIIESIHNKDNNSKHTVAGGVNEATIPALGVDNNTLSNYSTMLGSSNTHTPASHTLAYEQLKLEEKRNKAAFMLAMNDTNPSANTKEEQKIATSINVKPTTKHEKVVYDYEEADTNSFTSFITFFEEFHKKYNISKYPQYYTAPYNIYTPAGLTSEFIRRSIVCHFDTELFSSQYIKWATHRLHLKDRIKLSINRRVSKVDYKYIQLPEVYTHPKDPVVIPEHEFDTLFHYGCHTFKYFPPEVINNDNVSPVSVHNLDKAIIKIYDRLVSLQPALNEQQADRESKNNNRKITGSSYQPPVKIAQYANKIKNTKTTESPQTGVVSDSESESSSSSSSSPSSDTDSESDSDKQKRQKDKKKKKREKYKQRKKSKDSSESDEDNSSPTNHSMLSSVQVIDKLVNRFDMHTVSAINAVKGGTQLSGAQLIRQVPISSALLGKFKGDWESAPTFLSDYCSEIYKYNYSQVDAMSILQNTFHDKAKSWLVSKRTVLMQNEQKKNNILLHVLEEYIDYFLSATYIENHREKVYNTNYNLLIILHYKTMNHITIHLLKIKIIYACAINQ